VFAKLHKKNLPIMIAVPMYGGHPLLVGINADKASECAILI
jgi:hypothetical protein